MLKTSPARIKMIMMTTINSMMVTALSARNDEWLRRVPSTFVILHSFVIRHSSREAAGSRLLLQSGDDADERKEECDHNRPDDHREEYNHKWLENGRERSNGVVHLVI